MVGGEQRKAQVVGAALGMHMKGSLGTHNPTYVYLWNISQLFVSCE